jgi:hypothetical protein
MKDSPCSKSCNDPSSLLKTSGATVQAEASLCASVATFFLFLIGRQPLCFNCLADCKPLLSSQSAARQAGKAFCRIASADGMIDQVRIIFLIYTASFLGLDSWLVLLCLGFFL